jgi:hypothetical protein
MSDATSTKLAPVSAADSQFSMHLEFTDDYQVPDHPKLANVYGWKGWSLDGW